MSNVRINLEKSTVSKIDKSRINKFRVRKIRNKEKAKYLNTLFIKNSLQNLIKDAEKLEDIYKD